jgi:hypothetical protein
MENKWNQVLMTLSNHVPFLQVTVHLYVQDRSVKKWCRIVIVGTRVTWICARTICIFPPYCFWNSSRRWQWRHGTVCLWSLVFVRPPFVSHPLSSNFLIILLPLRFQQRSSPWRACTQFSFIRHSWRSGKWTPLCDTTSVPSSVCLWPIIST